MAFTQIPTQTRSATVEAIVTRADGTRQALGVIAYYHRNPILHAIGNARIAVRRWLRLS